MTNRPNYAPPPQGWILDLHPPRPRLTADGYTRREGSPTAYRALVAGRWRRVYVWQFSNAGTAFVRIKGEPRIIPDWEFPQ